MDVVPLSSLRPNMICRLHLLTISDGLRRRLQELGFVPGALLRCAFVAPLGSPMAIVFKNTLIALRRCDCDKILVKIVA